MSEKITIQEYWKTKSINLRTLLLKGKTFNKYEDQDLMLTDAELWDIFEKEKLDLGLIQISKYYNTKSVYSNLTIDNLRFCVNFKNIKELNIDGQEIKNLNGMEKHSSLIKISARESELQNLDAIRSIDSIKHVDFYACKKLTSLSGLINSNITNLDLTVCWGIKEFASLNRLTSLEVLNLTNTNIEKLSQISNLNNLRILIVSMSSRFKLNIVEGFESLRELYISKRHSDDKTIELFKEKYPNCRISLELPNIDIFSEKEIESNSDYKDKMDRFTDEFDMGMYDIDL